jgi:protein-S-isoprenylcysteine O-methyltransferase
MFTGIAQSLVTLAGIGAFYLVDFVLMSRYDSERSDEESGRSWSFTLMALGMAAALIAQPVIFPDLSLVVDAWWGLLIQAAGVALITGGLLLDAWSRIHLKQFYAERVEVQSDHQLIDTGPYAHIRHPFITSIFMIVGGCFLVNPAIPTLLVAAYTLWDFGGAARQEEILLAETLSSYATYMNRTPRFLPDIRSNFRKWIGVDHHDNKPED